MSDKPTILAETIQLTIYISPSLRKRWHKAARYRNLTPTLFTVEALRVAIALAEAKEKAEKAARKEQASGH